MSDLGGGAGAGAARAESQYAAARTSVWWDIENCPVPRNCDPHLIALNIGSALDNLGYRGRVSISAYGDTNNIPDSVQRALNNTGVSLNHIPAVDNPPPSNYLLISGDRDFSNALHQLGLRKYNVLLAQPQCASSVLVAAAKSVWEWPSLVAGGPPLSQLPEACNGNVNGNSNGNSNGRSVNNGNGSDNGRSANNNKVKADNNRKKGKQAKNPDEPINSFSGTPMGAAFPLHVLDIIGNVLTTFKKEKIPPTEANIADCIRKMNFDVRAALNYALESQYLAEHKLGKRPPYYTKKKEPLWKCVQECIDKKYPKETWDSIQKFLSSAKGKYAIQSSQCRYQAAKRLKKECLKTFVLGDILQILHVIINCKKWILPHATGWQPLSVTCPNTKSSDASTSL